MVILLLMDKKGMAAERPRRSNYSFKCGIVGSKTLIQVRNNNYAETECAAGYIIHNKKMSVDSVGISGYNNGEVMCFCGWLMYFWQIHRRRRPMGVEINNAVNAADTEAQYDEKAKRMTC